MKNKWYLYLFLLITTLMSAQTFSHIVIVVQENRTPDNLFGGVPMSIPGADVMAAGSAIPLGKGVDPDHHYSNFLTDLKKWNKNSIAYVQPSDIQPYVQLASQYGFANRMFQTNQGPSTPAHQFLFSGTSQPSEGSGLWEIGSGTTGCLGNTLVEFVDDSGQFSFGVDCLNPTTLSDLLDQAGISWHYYAPSVKSMWTAPLEIEHICQPNAAQTKCVGPNWANVTYPSTKVFTDIANGKLASVTWIIPSGANSDHPNDGNGGPAWVSSIVNAIGASPYWSNTVILVTWDDWGGWYDHVMPLQNDTGWCPSSCYGFRVPLLMISAYTPTNCIDNNNYDFGSILAFVDDTFALVRIGNADSFTPNSLSASPCINSGAREARRFKAVKSRRLTTSEMADRSDPDDD